MPELFCDNSGCLFHVDGKCTNDVVEHELADPAEGDLLLCLTYEEWQ